MSLKVCATTAAAITTAATAAAATAARDDLDIEGGDENRP